MARPSGPASVLPPSDVSVSLARLCAALATLLRVYDEMAAAAPAAQDPHSRETCERWIERLSDEIRRRKLAVALIDDARALAGNSRGPR